MFKRVSNRRLSFFGSIMLVGIAIACFSNSLAIAGSWFFEDCYAAVGPNCGGAPCTSVGCLWRAGACATPAVPLGSCGPAAWGVGSCADTHWCPGTCTIGSGFLACKCTRGGCG